MATVPVIVNYGNVTNDKIADAVDFSVVKHNSTLTFTEMSFSMIYNFFIYLIVIIYQFSI